MHSRRMTNCLRLRAMMTDAISQVFIVHVSCAERSFAMVRFKISVASPSIMAAISIHGARDIFHPRIAFPVYTTTLILLACDDELTTALFFASSVVHFAHDMADCLSASFLFVACVCMLSTRAPYLSSLIMTAYLFFIHVPLLVIRTWTSGEIFEAVALVGMLAGAAVRPCTMGVLPQASQMELSHFRQRIVVAHVFTSEILYHGM